MRLEKVCRVEWHYVKEERHRGTAVRLEKVCRVEWHYVKEKRHRGAAVRLEKVCRIEWHYVKEKWAEFLFCTGTGQPHPPQSPAALQAGSGEPKARVLTWFLSMGV